MNKKCFISIGVNNHARSVCSDWSIRWAAYMEENGRLTESESTISSYKRIGHSEVKCLNSIVIKWKTRFLFSLSFIEKTSDIDDTRSHLNFMTFLVEEELNMISVSLYWWRTLNGQWDVEKHNKRRSMRFYIVILLLINHQYNTSCSTEIDVDQYSSEFESDDTISRKLKLTIDRIQTSGRFRDRFDEILSWRWFLIKNRRQTKKNLFKGFFLFIWNLARRFQCPKGSSRYAGSCYFRSPIEASLFETNKTCRQVHSNRSNLILIDDPLEILFAAHFLTRENLSSLIVELLPNSYDQETFSKIFDRNRDRWSTMKKFSVDFRRKFRKFKNEIFYPMKNFSTNFFNEKKNLFTDEQFEGSEKIDPFENVVDLQKICFQIDFNIGKNNSNVFLLTTYSIADKIVCSLTEANFDEKYDFLCEYGSLQIPFRNENKKSLFAEKILVMDFCYANFLCGKHGRCFNHLSGFKCICYFLYGGFYCDQSSSMKTFSSCCRTFSKTFQSPNLAFRL